MGFSGGLARLARYTEGLEFASLYGMARLRALGAIVGFSGG